MLKEISFFIKDNKKVLSILSVILSLFFGVILYYLNLIRSTELLTDSFYDQENDQQVAFFDFYIEDSDGDAFTNSSLIETYLYSGEGQKKLKNKFNIDLLSVRNENFQETGDPVKSKPVRVVNNSGNHILSIVIDFEDESLNKKIAQFYYQQFGNNDISFLEGKKIYILRDPQIAQINSKYSPNLSRKSLILMPFLSLGLGFFGAIAIVIIRFLLKKEITYAFTYDAESGEQLLICRGNELSENNFLAYLDTSDEISKTYVGISKDCLGKLNETISITNSVNFIDDLSQYPNHKILNDEVIIFIFSNHTSKEWFKKQIMVLNLVNVPYRIIHIHNS